MSADRKAAIVTYPDQAAAVWAAVLAGFKVEQITAARSGEKFIIATTNPITGYEFRYLSQSAQAAWEWKQVTR